MNGKLFYWSIVSALAGFLFGFDTVVISGAEKSIQALWELSPLAHGLAISAALWGTVLGALVGAYPTDALGRRKTLIAIGVLYFVSAIWSALAGGVYAFGIARFIGGVGVGVSTVAAPLYISEIAPANLRGRLACLFQFNIVLGILIAFASNAALGNVGESSWRWMLAVEAVPALIYTVLAWTLPESPRWLVSIAGLREDAKRIYRLINDDADEASAQRFVDEVQAASQTKTAGSLLGAGLRKPISIAFLVAFFNQMSGINAILYFAPRIFEMTGLGDDAARLQSIGIGVINLLFTFLGLYLIDRLGRRTLLIIGSLGYIASLGLCAATFAIHRDTFAAAAGSTAGDTGMPGKLVLVSIFAFIAAHAIGQGAVIWVLISEIFPNRFRAAGQALGSATHWVFAALLTLVFPTMVVWFPPSVVFGFFAVMMAIQLVWVLGFVPETKGVPLEELSRRLGIEQG